MNLELIRLETFKNFPSSILISTIKLAKEGFYYSGDGDRVVCFACGSERSGWRNGDVPRDIHRQISPQCHLLSAGPSNNIPVGGVPNGLSTNQQRASLGQSGSIHNESRQDIVNSNTTSTNLVQSNSIHQNESNHHVGFSKNESNNDNASDTPTVTRGQVTVTSNGEVSNSLSGLNSNSESQSRNVACAHNTGEPISKPDTNTVLKRSRNIQEKINAYLRGLDPLGIIFERPKYNAYAVLATRISSFKDWPTNMTQTPRDLATAGFLYAGFADYTRCFFCGGGLRNWESGDDPWTEHARWFPKCAFLRQNKGDEFVALVQIEHQEQEEIEARDIAHEYQHHVPNGRSHLDIPTLPSFQSVLEMGYSTDVVKEAFSQLKVTKDPYEITGQNLMEVILSNEDGLDIPPPIHNSGPLRSMEDVARNANSQQSVSGTSQENQPSTSNEPQLPTQGASGRSEGPQLPTQGASGRSVGSQNEPQLATQGASERSVGSQDNKDTASLIEENRKLKDLLFCKICRENDASIVMLPRGHPCADCAPAMRKCPICRQFVIGTVRIRLVLKTIPYVENHEWCSGSYLM